MDDIEATSTHGDSLARVLLAQPLLVAVNAEIRGHMVEEVGEELRDAMDGMKAI